MAATLNGRVDAGTILDFLERHGYSRQCFTAIELDQIHSNGWKGFYGSIERKKKRGLKPYAEEPCRQFFLYANSHRRDILVEYTSETFKMFQLNEGKAKLMTSGEHDINDSWKHFLKMRGIV